MVSQMAMRSRQEQTRMTRIVAHEPVPAIHSTGLLSPGLVLTLLGNITLRVVNYWLNLDFVTTLLLKKVIL